MPNSIRALSTNCSAPANRDFGQREAQAGIVFRTEGPGTAGRFSHLAPFDYLLIAGMWVLTIPAFLLARLPYSFDLAALARVYLAMPVGSVFVATMLAIVGLPFSETVQPFLSRLRICKAAAVILVCVGALLWLEMGPAIGTIVFVDALGCAAFWQRCGGQIGSKLLDLFIPAVYLFVGLVAVFAFNHAIVGIRYAGTNDANFGALDYKLFGTDVPSIAGWGVHHFPMWMLRVFEFIYFSLWSRLGAALLLVAVLGRRRDAVQFVRNILVCYALALMIFAAVPGKGPYSTLKVRVLPRDLTSYCTQQVLMERGKKLFAHTLTEDVRQVGIGDYYISFPSLHAALPLIAIWFLRRWKRIQVISAMIYFGLLVPSLVFLDWHYLVDILGGWAISILSILLTEAISRPRAVSWREGNFCPTAAAD